MSTEKKTEQKTEQKVVDSPAQNSPAQNKAEQKKGDQNQKPDQSPAQTKAEQKVEQKGDTQTQSPAQNQSPTQNKADQKKGDQNQKTDQKKEGEQQQQPFIPPIISTTKLRIRFLPWQTSKNEVYEICRRFGTPTSVETIKNSALVNFSNAKEAQYALHFLEGSPYKGNTLRVDFAREPREQQTKKPGDPQNPQQNPQNQQNPQQNPQNQQNPQQNPQQQQQQAKNAAPVAEKTEATVRFSAQQQLANPTPKQHPPRQQQQQLPKPQQQPAQQQQQQQHGQRPNQKNVKQQKKQDKGANVIQAPTRKYKVTVETENENNEKLFTVTISQQQYSKFIIPLMNELLSSTK